METYDLIIVGGSAAATTAGIYAARRNLHFKIITQEFGGEVATSGEIGNWPGISQTDGLTLAQQFKAHLAHYKVELEEGVWVEKIVKRDDGIFEIWSRVEGGGTREVGRNFGVAISALGRAVIVTTGVHPRELNVPGEKAYRNKGVSYCSVCDMPLFGGKVVATIGGGNSALESALMGADIASQVYLLNKNPQFKGDQILLDNLKTKTNVQIIYGAKTSAITGEQFVKGLNYLDSGEQVQTLAVDGIFVHIGMTPNSGLVPAGTDKDASGQIVVNKNCETNIPGLYAAGDVTDLPHNQIVIAAGMGATALLSAVNYLNHLK